MSRYIIQIYQGVVDSIELHPFPLLDHEGLFLTINTDDPPLFNTTLTKEYLILSNILGYDRKNLVRIARQAFMAAGMEKPLKDKLVGEFDAWVGSI